MSWSLDCTTSSKDRTLFRFQPWRLRWGLHKTRLMIQSYQNWLQRSMEGTPQWETQQIYGDFILKRVLSWWQTWKHKWRPQTLLNQYVSYRLWRSRTGWNRRNGKLPASHIGQTSNRRTTWSTRFTAWLRQGPLCISILRNATRGSMRFRVKPNRKPNRSWHGSRVHLRQLLQVHWETSTQVQNWSFTLRCCVGIWHLNFSICFHGNFANFG